MALLPVPPTKEDLITPPGGAKGGIKGKKTPTQAQRASHKRSKQKSQCRKYIHKALESLAEGSKPRRPEFDLCLENEAFQPLFNLINQISGIVNTLNDEHKEEIHDLTARWSKGENDSQNTPDYDIQDTIDGLFKVQRALVSPSKGKRKVKEVENKEEEDKGPSNKKFKGSNQISTLIGTIEGRIGNILKEVNTLNSEITLLKFLTNAD